MTLREALQRAIRPSTTRSTGALWAKSLLNAVLFFAVFMLALPWLANRLLPVELPVPPGVRTWLAGALAIAGVAAWVACLDSFSRRGRGTPLPADAPRELVSSGLFGRTRNPIMAAELSVIWAIALNVASLGVALYAAAITALAHVLVVHVEEPELRARFGPSYDAYCRRVPRWLPRLGRARVGNRA
jgi:protein-S-isoprenylcysteine O-methyltransferase Ste14